MWTPEGFYEATPSARDVLRWVVNHGPDERRDNPSRLGHPETASAGHVAARASGTRNRPGARDRGADGRVDWRSRKRQAALSHLAGCCTCSRSASISSAKRPATCILTTQPRTPTTSRQRCKTARRLDLERQASTSGSRVDTYQTIKPTTQPSAMRSTTWRQA